MKEIKKVPVIPVIFILISVLAVSCVTPQIGAEKAGAMVYDALAQGQVQELIDWSVTPVSVDGEPVYLKEDLRLVYSFISGRLTGTEVLNPGVPLSEVKLPKAGFEVTVLKQRAVEKDAYLFTVQTEDGPLSFVAAGERTPRIFASWGVFK